MNTSDNTNKKCSNLPPPPMTEIKNDNKKGPKKKANTSNTYTKGRKIAKLITLNTYCTKNQTK